MLRYVNATSWIQQRDKEATKVLKRSSSISLLQQRVKAWKCIESITQTLHIQHRFDANLKGLTLFVFKEGI